MWLKKKELILMKNKFRIYISVILKNKLVRFFLVSGINTAFGYGLFAFFLYLSLNYSIALLISTIIGIIFNFKTIGSLVFKNKNNMLIIKFFGVYLITFLCNLGCLSIFKYFDVNLYFGGAILVIPIGLLGYKLHSKLVFKNIKTHENTKTSYNKII